jgi:hypothetical protein
MCTCAPHLTLVNLARQERGGAMCKGTNTRWRNIARVLAEHCRVVDRGLISTSIYSIVLRFVGECLPIGSAILYMASLEGASDLRASNKREKKNSFDESERLYLDSSRILHLLLGRWLGK